jgi:predicted RNA binding protein YcfA (HicA-like mRNA interferase family)
MRASELLRRRKRRASRLAIEHEEVAGKGSDVEVRHGAGRAVIPKHSGDMPLGTYRAILRQLGLIEADLED